MNEYRGPALTTEELAHARGQNRIWRARLGKHGWPSPLQLRAAWIEADLDREELVFIRHVAEYQRDAGLHVDGVLGPKTAALVRAQSYEEPAAAEYIVVAGKQVPVSCKVILPAEAGGLEFKATDKGIWLRDAAVTTICMHAKGAEGTALGTWSFLRSRGRGVHYTIERDGTVWQFADPAELSAAHAGLVNDFAVGIEMTNQVWPTVPNPHGRPIVRDTYVGRDPRTSSYGHPMPREILGMLDAQLHAMVALVTTLCGTLSIPRTIPAYNGRFWPGLLPDLRSCQGKKLQGRISVCPGVIAHLNVTNNHQDPGADVFQRLLAAGFALQTVHR